MYKICYILIKIYKVRGSLFCLNHINYFSVQECFPFITRLQYPQRPEEAI